LIINGRIRGPPLKRRTSIAGNGVQEWHGKKYLAALICPEVPMSGTRDWVMLALAKWLKEP
jgi:hypothetical protein